MTNSKVEINVMALKMKLIVFFALLGFIFMIAGISNTFATTDLPEIVFEDSCKMNILPVGSGARALGMGGAFIAIADDATAISWNPAGLVNLERPEATMVVSYIYTVNDFQDFTSSGSLSVSQYRFGSDEEIDTLDINFLNFSYPFVFFNKFSVFSLGYQQIYDFNTNFKYKIKTSDDLPKPYNLRTTTLDYQSTGGIAAISPAFAVLFSKDISFGITLNILDNKFGKNYTWKEEFKSEIIPIDPNSYKILTRSEQKVFDSFSAYNFSFGLLYDIFKKKYKELTIGLTYESEYTEEITKNRMRLSKIIDLSDPNKSIENLELFKSENINITFPQGLSFGISYQIDKSLTISFDMGWIDWSEWILEKQDGRKYRPIGYEVPVEKKIRDTYPVKAGIEYLLYFEDKIIPFRGGLFYDPQPSIGNPIDVFGFSIGTGLTKKQFCLDIAYIFRYADNIDTRDFGIIGGQYDELEHRLFSSLIIKF